MTGEANLASSFAAAHQDSRSQFEPLRARQLFQRGPRNRLRLIESALRLLALIERNGNHRDRSHGHSLFHAGNRLRQHAPQNCRRRTNLLKLEQMDQVAQSAVIAAIGNRPLERRINAPAERAPRVFNFSFSLIRTIRLCAIDPGRDTQGLSANHAVLPLQRPQRAQTTLANGKPGNSQKWGTADTAIGRKKREEQGRKRALGKAGERMICQTMTCKTMISQIMFRRLALGCPYSKPSTTTATAEDVLPHPAS